MQRGGTIPLQERPAAQDETLRRNACARASFGTNIRLEETTRMILDPTPKVTAHPAPVLTTCTRSACARDEVTPSRRRVRLGNSDAQDTLFFETVMAHAPLIASHVQVRFLRAEKLAAIL